jgi:hypothetical protein
MVRRRLNADCAHTAASYAGRSHQTMERKVYRLMPAVSAGGFGVPTKSDTVGVNPESAKRSLVVVKNSICRVAETCSRQMALGATAPSLSLPGK